MKRNVKQYTKGVKAIKPQEATAAVVGEVIDRDFAREVVVTLVTGAAKGTPTKTGVKFVVKHGDKSDGTDQVAVGTDLRGTFESTTIGADSVASVGVDVEGLKRYITIVATPTFEGGTTPSVLVAATAVLGNYEINPDHVGADGKLTYGKYAGDGKGY